MGRNRTLWSPLGMAVAVGGFAVFAISREVNQVREGRRELLEAYESISTGRVATPADLRAPVGGNVRIVGTNQFYLSPPFSLLMPTWNLWGTLSNGRVMQLKVRTADSLDDHPPEAPPDWVNDSEPDRSRP